MSCWILIAGAVVVGCSQPPPVKEQRADAPRLDSGEVERRLRTAREHAVAADEPSGIELLTLTMSETLESNDRREVARTIAELRRSLFYRDHPLHLAIDLDRERYGYGEVARVRMSIANLGGEVVVIDGVHRGFVDGLFGRRGERAAIDVVVERRECDALGSRVLERRSLPVELDRDVEIEPGAAATLDVAIPIEAKRGTLFGIVSVEAVLRPVAIASADQARYDPLRFGTARASMVRSEIAPWYDAGLEGLGVELSATPRDRPEALLLAAAGLPDADVRAGLDQIARAMPNLDVARQALAGAAFEWLSGFHASNDPLAALTWWDQDGRSLPDAGLVRQRWGGPLCNRVLLAGGAPSPSSGYNEEPEARPSRLHRGGPSAR